MDYASARAQLIAQLRHEIRDEKVLAIMARLPRELFVPHEERSMAYEDRPLPIGLGQTISQPFIIALMTSALEIKGDEKVLEIGTGSGYQAAILAGLARKVITVERLPHLAEEARRHLAHLGYTNVEVHIAGKTLGWPAEAPYKAIVVTAAAPCIPQELLEQMAMGGRMVIPVGSHWEQDLLRVTRLPKGMATENLGGCRFVPLIGEGAWPD